MFEIAVDRLASAVRTAAGVLLVIVAAAMLTVILGRYIGFATAWADEVARIAFVWSVCLGAASGTRRGLHFVVVQIARKPPGKAKQLLETATVLVVVSLCVLMIWATTQSIPVATLLRLPALGVSAAWFHSAVTVFAALTATFLLSRALLIWRPAKSTANSS